MTSLAGDRTADTSGQVINLYTNTAFKCVPHILGYLQFLQMVAELCANAHYYLFCSLSQFPLGKKSFQLVSRSTRTYTLSHQGRTSYLQLLFYTLLQKFDYFWPKEANLMVYFENLSYNPVRVRAHACASAHTHSYMLHACRPELASTET